MKRFIALFLVAMMLLGMTACSTSSKDDKFFNEKDPIQITDGLGRRVSFPKPVETIATSWGGTCDAFLFALGLQDRLVATNSKNDFHKQFIPNIEEFPSVGRWVLDKEALAEISPDLFIHGAAGTEYLQGANKVGVRSLGLSLNSFEDIAFSIEMLGKVFGVEERAAFVNQCSQDILDLIAERTSKLSDEEKLTVVVLGSETGQVACDIYNAVEQMVVMSGGKSVVPEEIAKKDEITNVGLETIFKWDADVIFLQGPYCELTDEGILADPTWANLTSVKNGRVFTIPSELHGWSDASPASCLGALYMSMQMYPELYEDVDFEAIVIQFYKDVFGLDLTAEELGL